MNNNKILGPDGNPINKPDSTNDLPVEIQNLVEIRVNSALDVARENLRQEISNAKEALREEIADKKRVNIIRYILLVIGNAVVGVLLWVYGPSEVKQWTKQFVADNMSKPALETAARDVITNRMDRFVSEKLAPLSGEINLLHSSVQIAQEQANQLQEEQRLTTLLNRGEVFDKDAIHELQIIAQSTNDTALLAQAMFNKIQRNLLIDSYASSWVTYVESVGDKRYGGPFTSDEFALCLSDTSGSSLDGLVNILGNNKLFVPRLVELAHQSKDMWTISRIAKKLKEIAGVDFFPWDLRPLDKWWAENGMNYTNWPSGQYSKAIEAFRAVKYDEAQTNFDRVLIIDPTADKSRAYAVACAIETGNIQKAQQLNTGYAVGDGRWEQWAEGKMMLATNAIQQGTEKFASLSKKYPTFLTEAFIVPGNHVLRQIDWDLYSKLMQPTNNAASANIN